MNIQKKCYEYEIENKDYSFLNACKGKGGGEDSEVTYDSMYSVYSKYDYYRNNYNEPEERKKAKPQMSSSYGWSISRKDSFYDSEQLIPCINVVCDVLTSCTAFRKETDITKFEKIYHTIGNFMPIPEGSNFKPGQAGKIGNCDHFEFKLNKIKSFFDEKNIIAEDEMYQISKRIEIGFGLGSNWRKKIDEKNKELNLELKPLKPLTECVQLRYWIQFEWKNKGKSWKDFVEDNYLQDFVDLGTNEWIPLKFDASNSLDVCKLIIKRGSRICKANADIDKIWKDI